MVWIEIDHDQARDLPFRQGGDDVFDRRLSRQLDGRIRKPRRSARRTNLSHRFLAGDIDRPVTGTRERGSRLDQQSRFSDARVAADQQDRTAHETAAGDTVELGNPGDQARGIVGLASQGLERKQASFTGLATRPGRTSAPSSLSVFHSPQASHLPCQRLKAAPQFWQTKVRLRLDMGNRRKMAVREARVATRTIQEQFLRRY